MDKRTKITTDKLPKIIIDKITSQLFERCNIYAMDLLEAINKKRIHENSDISLKLEWSQIFYNVFHPVFMDIKLGLMTKELCQHYMEASISFLRNLSIPQSTDPMAVTRKGFYVDAHQMRLDYLEKVMNELDKVVD